MSRRRAAGPVVGLAGAGRAGGACAAALRGATSSPPEVVIWDRRPEKARALASRLRVHSVSRLDDFLGAADHLLLAVRDDALPAFVRRLAAVWPERGGPASVVHLAGALGSGVLDPLERPGLARGVFHPVLPLLGPASGNRLGGALATVSGSDLAGLRAARRLCRWSGCVALPLADRQRPLFHAAAVMAAGDVVAWLGLVLALWERCGIPPTRTRRLLGALSGEALDQLRRHRPGKALTGPAARADLATLLAHAKALSRAGRAGRVAFPLHLLLVLAGAREARREGRISPAALRRLKGALSGELRGALRTRTLPGGVSR